MKHIIFCSCLLAVVAAVGMTDTERQYIHNLALRPRCESRQCVVIGGVSNVVEVWRRNEYTWSQTNKVRRIVGTWQSNTYQDKINGYAADANMTRKAKQAAKKAGKNLEKVVKTIEKARDKSSTEEEAALYQSLLDIINGTEAAQ